MKKKIVILGSTGSIGQNTLEIIRANKSEFEITLLSTNKNISEIFKQVQEFKVKNVIIKDYKNYLIALRKFKNHKVKIYNKFDEINKILNKIHIYYSMVAISGLDGLKPTLLLTKYSKNLAIVNKESLICGWSLIYKSLKKYKTNFIPIDSEHFSIFSLLQNHNLKEVERIYITASGGPFINLPKNKFSKIKLNDALKHPNWSMGKKITIDSATLMNKVFEVIEAKNIFNIGYDKISILTHPKSYVHAIIKFNNGLCKILAHEPDMKIPIYNSIYPKNTNKIKVDSLNLNTLNNLNLKKVDVKKFPLVKLLKKLPNQSSLYETVIITINDYFVFKFLDKKINFQKLISLINKFSNLREFQKYKKIKPTNIDEIYRLRDYVSSKMDSLAI
jgi:1-deoxy-D-xylulose-5-phosphate reductoisomerase